MYIDNSLGQQHSQSQPKADAFQAQKEVPMYYSGIDLHSDNCYITTLDDSGVVVKRQRVDNCNKLVLDYFHSLPGDHQAVVESTTGWYWLNDLLGDNGIELILAHAKYLCAKGA